jgi:hypothetical protein
MICARRKIHAEYDRICYGLPQSFACIAQVRIGAARQLSSNSPNLINVAKRRAQATGLCDSPSIGGERSADPARELDDLAQQ